MKSLGVPVPDMVTRVSEFVPEIIEFISVLIEKNIAYESNGSVYFNTKEFEMAGHKYGKLMPEQIGNSELLAEGEGALSVNDDKKNPTDFALWKRMKEHTDGTVEPSWSSPWGDGRPGWHIECSVMSSFAVEKLGTGGLDVHAGGNDLKFPHHENEIAQSEAFMGTNQWVNYWIHAGHLNIKGFKMSKSLKNFITIRQALQEHTARQIRFCFLLHKYNAPMDYGDGTMSQALSIERIFTEYFHNVKALLRRVGMSDRQYISSKEHDILLSFENTKISLRNALADDFDTPRALHLLLDLIRSANRYLEDSNISTAVVINIAKYITSVLRTFGLVRNATEIGFPLENVSEDLVGQSKEESLAPYLDVLTAFRESVRMSAISGDTSAVLQAADHLRDNILPDLGVRMEDKGSGKDVVTVWKLEDPEVLRRERLQKEEAKLAKEAAKEEKRRKDKEREELSKIPPDEYFRRKPELYTAFDEKGIPIKDGKGEPINKSVSKKLKKEFERQKELHEKYLSTRSDG